MGGVMDVLTGGVGEGVTDGVGDGLTGWFADGCTGGFGDDLALRTLRYASVKTGLLILTYFLLINVFISSMAVMSALLSALTGRENLNI